MSSLSLPHDGVVDIMRWPDAHATTHGHRIDDDYVELFWLPILGPTSTWLLRRLARGLLALPHGYSCDLASLAQSLGVSYSAESGAFARAVNRCVMFGMCQQIAVTPRVTLAVRTHVPTLSRRHRDRLPSELNDDHDTWLARRHQQMPFHHVAGLFLVVAVASASTVDIEPLAVS